jgi:diguanylate cyclase
MTLEYNLDTRLGALVPVLEEYSEWFLRVVSRIFYPDAEETEQGTARPESFYAWLEKAVQDGISASLTQKLRSLHDDMCAGAEKLLADAQESRQRPEYKAFKKFVTLYEEFIHHLHRLEMDLLQENNGIDALTGLRSIAALEKDVAVEMERLSRQGRPFCLALVRINHMDQITQSLGYDGAQEYIRLVSSMIKESMRTFDDAYRLGESEFVLSLKQADVNGGFKALERLKRALDTRKAVYTVDGEEKRLSLLSCIAEPTPEDDINVLISDMQTDIDGVDGDESTVLEYSEISPLQRFARKGIE